MLFRLDYAISVENVKSAQERFATMDEKRDGLTVIGRWHEAGNRGFMVCEMTCSCFRKVCQPMVGLMRY